MDVRLSLESPAADSGTTTGRGRRCRIATGAKRPRRGSNSGTLIGCYMAGCEASITLPVMDELFVDPAYLA